HVAGPYCTKLMSGFGARVVKVEPPRTGDPQRGVGPFVRGEPGIERSLPFQWLNTGKESISLSLEGATGVSILKRLIGLADVLIESFPPGAMDRLGLDDGTVSRINPRIVRTSITGFGADGPYSGFTTTEAVSYAMSGGMVSTGDPARAPLAPGPAVTQYTAGMHAYIGTLMALYRREKVGAGERVEVSIQESALENIEVHLVEHLHKGAVARRTADTHAMVPWQCHPCADGLVAVVGGPIRHWLKAVPMFEEPRLSDPKYRHMGGRIQNRAEVESLMSPWLRRHGKREIYHEGQKRGLAFGYLANLEESTRSPQHAARGFIRTIEHPVAGSLRMPGPPFRFEEDGWRDKRAPLLGEQNEAVYAGMLNLSSDEMGRLSAEGVI
ncbi:MAG TPA: CoA transferase, partial [Candidatus Polarisedimenticolia bacterium]|nr:CoA transferase [Candidatus Polarisedimenticolia bacterium]